MTNRNVVLGLACVTLFTGPALRAEEPAVPEKEWKNALNKMDPFRLLQRVREAAARTRATENLKQIGPAIHQYQNHLPPTADTANPMIPNWHNYLLPYIEQSNVYSLPTGNRLGARWTSVGEAMQTQLGLAKDKGLLLAELDANSAGTKAGLKKYDILLQWNGKDVTGNVEQFLEVLKKAPDTAESTARVLRGGKEMDVKGIVLNAAIPGPIKTYIAPSAIQDGTSSTILFGDAYRFGSTYFNSWAPSAAPASEAQSKVLTTTFRQEDRFTARYQEGSLIITITGQMKKDAAAVQTIKVIDGAIEHRYESIDKTPAEYRDKARDLVKAAEKNQDRIEIQKNQPKSPSGNW